MRLALHIMPMIFFNKYISKPSGSRFPDNLSGSPKAVGVNSPNTQRRIRETLEALHSKGMDTTRAASPPPWKKDALRVLREKNVQHSDKVTHVHFDSMKYKIGSEDQALNIHGGVYTPFGFHPKIDEVAVLIAQEKAAVWAKDVGLCPDHPLAMKKLKSMNFAQFAACTTVKFEIPPTMTAADLRGDSAFDKIQDLLVNRTRPASEAALTRKTQYLEWLFKHDDWAEQQSDIKLVRAVHKIMKTCFDSEGNTSDKFERKEYNRLIDEFEHKNPSLPKKSSKDRDEEFNLITAFINASKGLAKGYALAFNELFKDSGGNKDDRYIGYRDFVKEIGLYFQGVEEESDDRIKGRIVDKDTFEDRRYKTSAVFTVYLAALLESGLKIERRSVDGNSPIENLKKSFCQIVCRFNAGFSAKREFDTPNWVNNDLAVFKKKDEESYDQARDLLFEKINIAMANAEINMGYLDPGDLQVLLFAAVLQQWGIGSIPAQMVTGRYDENRAEGPYLKGKENGLRIIPEGPHAFWEALTPGA